jgi:hypothetical protein
VTFKLQPSVKAEGEYSHVSTLSLNSAADGGRCIRPRSGRYIPGKDPVPTAYVNGLALGRTGLMKKILNLSEFDSWTCNTAANRYNDGAYSTPVILDVTHWNFNPYAANVENKVS